MGNWGEGDGYRAVGVGVQVDCKSHLRSLGLVMCIVVVLFVVYVSISMQSRHRAIMVSDVQTYHLRSDYGGAACGPLSFR